MNKIYKVIYSKVKQCYIVVSELAKSHVKSAHGSNGQQKAALTTAVLLALGTFSVASVFMPITAEAAQTKTDGSNFVGVERTDGLLDDSKYDNYGGKGANGADSITLGLNAQAGAGTITIGDRNAGASLGSVYVGQGDIAKPKLDTGGWATSIGYNSDATGYGSIALGSNAVAKNSYEKDSKGESLELNQSYVDNGVTKVRLNSKPDIQRASVAIGYGASADNGNIAIGSYSDASTDLRTVKDDSAKAYLTGNTADSYVSVGKTGALRRISNVADGASVSDVATVGQLQALAAKSGTYKAGFGIEITPDTTTKENTIKLSRNLGRDMDSTDKATLVADESKNALVLGGRVEEGQSKKGQVVEKPYGAFGQDSVVVGGANNIADKDGLAAVVVGGTTNTASAQYSTVAGGNNNDAFGNESSVFGGFDNDAFGAHATLSGGSMNRAYGEAASVFGGAMNSALGASSVAVGGLQSTVNGAFAVGIAGGSTNANHALAAGNGANVTVENGTAIGYQATTDEANTIAFGHDAGDVSGYTIKWKQRTDGKTNADHTTNDYTQVPDSVTPTTYKDAYYNRLVKVADGQDDHDVVVMEQLKQYAEKDASNLGNNIKVYKTDGKGNVQLDKDKNPVEDTGATTTAQKNSKDDWGKALGAGTLTAATAKESDQLVTGKTLYNYDKPTGSTNYVNANNTTGQNLSALDAQVKANADTLKDKTHNIKYYSVDESLPKINGYTNEGNDGAKGMGSLAAGFNTHADGIASTVAGSYSSVINTGDVKLMGYDFRGATALSYGTFNSNQSTAQSGVFSGVANSIVGQANMTTDSNAAIIYGAGNTITNSYRDIDISKFDLSKVKQDIAKKDAAAVAKDLQEAVSTSGGQVMVMGGGNSVDKAYMTQVLGVGNKVTGHDTTYAEGTSTQYNYVDGFQNTLTNGKNDYIIGANNSVTGDSIDKNQSNIVVGDNHTLNNEKNNVVLGSADSSKELAASGAVVIGHNADVSVDGGVALGSDSVASVKEGQKGYDPAEKVTNKTTAPWTSTKAAVSVGKADGSVTRQITGVAAGTKDTDAVNVAQIKKLASVDASNIGKNIKDGDVTTNENAWGEALGTGTVTKDNKQLVTGGTVYNEVRPSKDGEYVKIAQTTGANLIALDDQVKTNTDKLSDVDSRSVKYDTKTENGKTVVDNAKITLAGEDGTTITHLKAGVNDSDAATVGQLNSKIAGVTYTAGNGIAMDSTAKTISAKAGNGITVDTNGINAKAGTGITVNANGINVNTGKHLSVNASGQVDVDDNGEVAANDGNLVTGKTVYDALHGGLDNITVGKDGQNGKDGSIGIAGQNGKDGYTMTIIKTEKGADGVDGKNGQDGITRIVYQDKDDNTGKTKQTVATLDDGLKFMDDFGTTAKVKLDNVLNVVGDINQGVEDESKKKTADALSTGNIGVVATDTTYKDDGTVETPGKLTIKLAKDLKGMNSTEYTSEEKPGEGDQQKTTTTINSKGLTITDGPSITKDGIDAGNKAITKVASGLGKDSQGSYNKEQNGTNAANLNDVNKMITDATGGTGTIGKELAKKANVDASNIGKNYKDGDATANEIAWGDAIGTGKIEKDNGQLVTGKTVYDEVRPKENGNYVKTNQTTGENLSALDSKIGKLDETKKYNYLDSGKNVSISNNLTKLDTQVKNNADAIKENSKSIQDITNNVKNLSNNAVQYDEDSNKSKVTLAGKDGTTITNVKDGALSENSSDAVNGKQLYNEQEARKAADKAITEKVTNNTNEITKIKDGEGFTEKGKTVIKSLAQDAVDVKGSDYVTVTNETKDGTKTFTVSVDGNGKVASGNKGLISGDTIYNELRPSADGSYIKQAKTTAQNLVSLDTQVKKTSDLINSDGKTIKIGGSDAATKIDVNGKDGKGRVITGVVSDANDPNSAANVGYVNGITSASNEQIYRDMNMQYNHVENDISRAAAGSNALAALHPMQEFDPDDKAQYALGYGHYRNSNAGAVGVFYQPDENSLFSLGASFGNGDAGINAGVTFKFGPGGSGHHALTKTQMAKVIDAQSKEIDALKKDNADKDKRIDALEQKVNEILAKVEKDKA